MTLAKKTMIRLGALSAAMLTAGAAAIWCLLMLQSLNNVTHEEFNELREIRPVERALGDAAASIASGDRATAGDKLDSILDDLRDFVQEQESGESRLDVVHAEAEQGHARRTISAIQKLRANLAESTGESMADDAKLVAAARSNLNDLIDEFETAVAKIHTHTTNRFQVVLISLVVCFVAVAIGAVVVSLTQYRAVIGPLNYVRDGVRTVANGALSTRLEPRGDAEFTELQRDFNTMAGELESLYRDLEQRVADQGRRLAVSERLASVGFLAAGVAHEINNPLAIMSGHAQSALRRARQGGDAKVGDVTRDLEIIRDEAFRAKAVIQQLLELSSGGSPTHAPVSLRSVMYDVAGILHDTPISAGKVIRTAGDESDPLVVAGSEPELRQVVLNLTMNAAHAVAPDRGVVELSAKRSNGWVELEVRDNGCGMPPEVLEHVFEPFFSSRKGRGGVGLGLTISHAIVERHGGELVAESKGPSCGSVFTMRLPSGTGATD